MFKIKQHLNKKEKQHIKNILDNVVDLFGDFYCTQQNIRIPLRDNPTELFGCLKKGSQIIYEADKENGVALILREKGFRTYLKVLTKDLKLANNFLKIVNWNIKAEEEIFVKLHKNNPLINVFQHNGYSFRGNRGQEILLSKQFMPKLDYSIDKGEEDNGY